MALFSIIILAFLWFFQVVSLSTYYKWYKTKEIGQISNTLKKNYNNNDDLLDNLAFNNGICIEVVKDNAITYTSNSFNRGCIIGDIQSGIDYKTNFIGSGVERRNYELINPRFKNKTIVSAIALSSGTYAFVSASLEPLDSSIILLKNQFIYVSLLVLCLAFLIGYFISKKISSPMEKIGKAAQRMAKGDYQVVFDPGTDIDELKQLALTLDFTRDELSKTDELRRELLSNVGHDLKTPLTMIQAYAEMVRDLSYQDKEKRDGHLNIIVEETKRLNLLVNDILELSSMQSHTLALYKEVFSLHDLMQNILQRYTILKETEKYSFHYTNKKNLLVEADRKRIEQVIYNLINNAIQYTGKDNQIYIEIKETETQVKVMIRDTGKGIQKEEQKYIWDKYYHSNKKHKRNAIGTGLGLSIVKNILEMHKSIYGVLSSTKGTTFYFTLEKSIQ